VAVHRRVIGIPILDVLGDTTRILHTGKLEFRYPRLDFVGSRIRGKCEQSEGDVDGENKARQGASKPFCLSKPSVPHNVSDGERAFRLPRKSCGRGKTAPTVTYCRLTFRLLHVCD